MADDLQDVQLERAQVKKALRDNGVFLGMSGETLAQYFLQLNEKENLLLSQKLQAVSTEVAAPEVAAPEVATPEAVAAPEVAAPEVAITEVAAPEAAITNGTGGYATAAVADRVAALEAAASAPVAEPVLAPAANPDASEEPALATHTPPVEHVTLEQLLARELPSEAPERIDRDSLLSVSAHMCRYEASCSESGKALRALASLAYATPSKVADHSDVLPQTLRLLSLHPSDDNVQIYGMRSLCNMASNRSVALNKLSSADILGALVGTMVSRSQGSTSQDKEISAKACETVARIVVADVSPPRPADAPPAWLDIGPLRVLLTLVSAEDESGREVVVQLLQQFISNEVSTSDYLAKRLVAYAAKEKESDSAATAWLLLVKQVAKADFAEI